MSSSNGKQIGLITCTALVAGNMMGSGVALLPASLASIGSIAIFSWILTLIGALGLAYVFARLATVNPQEGGPIAYAGEISPVLGFQTSVLYYNANWIGNLAIAITAVAYLSVFFPVLTNPVPAGIAVISAVWLFTLINLLGGGWVAKLCTGGLVLILIPVVMTATLGWTSFDANTYMDNWNTSGSSDNSAFISAVLLCLWAFIGIESASVSSGLVRNPKRTVPLATMLGTSIAGVIYISATQAIAGMFPAEVVAASGAPFALSSSKIMGEWSAPIVSAFTAFACFTSLGSWMMLVGQAGKRATEDGYFPAIYGEVDKNGIPKKGLILASLKMTALMIVLTIFNSSGANVADIFAQLTSIAVLLTILPYFYSAVSLLRYEGLHTRHILGTAASIIAAAFCFVALDGSGAFQLAATITISMIVLMFYASKPRPA